MAVDQIRPVPALPFPSHSPASGFSFVPLSPPPLSPPLFGHQIEVQ